jgi:hypothetical protein
LRVIQQTQKRLFEIVALLCRLDLIIEFDFTIHRVLIPKLWQAAAPFAVSPLAPASLWNITEIGRASNFHLRMIDGLVIVKTFSGPLSQLGG